MANLQKTLDSLQPYVIGIRYIDNMTVVDTIFKTGWILPESKVVKKVKGEDESLNYYMIFTDVPNFGLDELVDYISHVIKINLDREMKHELLRAKVNELKEFFKKHTLAQLSKLKFTLVEEELTPQLNEFDVEDTLNEIDSEPVIEEPKFSSPSIPVVESADMYNAQMQPPQVPLTEEEEEMLAEEARAANYMRMKEAEKLNGAIKSKQKVELPPRKRIGEAIMSNTAMPDCDCGPLEACSKCLEYKDL